MGARRLSIGVAMFAFVRINMITDAAIPIRSSQILLKRLKV